MTGTCRVLATVLVLLLVSASGAMGQQQVPKDDTMAYVFSILIGFGTGHFYLQDPAAVRFLLLDAGALTAVVAGSVVTLAALYTDTYSTELPTGYVVGLGIMLAGSLLYGTARIWEVVDIFKTVNELQAAGRVTMRPSLGLGPAAMAGQTAAQRRREEPDRIRVQVGVTLAY